MTLDPWPGLNSCQPLSSLISRMPSILPAGKLFSSEGAQDMTEELVSDRLSKMSRKQTGASKTLRNASPLKRRPKPLHARGHCLCLSTPRRSVRRCCKERWSFGVLEQAGGLQWPPPARLLLIRPPTPAFLRACRCVPVPLPIAHAAVIRGVLICAGAAGGSANKLRV